MGMIDIHTHGSFGESHATFSAIENGHAHAVAEAIAYLTNDLLIWSTNQDHSLHEAGEKPNKGFQKVKEK